MPIADRFHIVILMACWQKPEAALKNRPDLEGRSLAVGQRLRWDNVERGHENCFHFDLRRELEPDRDLCSHEVWPSTGGHSSSSASSASVQKGDALKRIGR